jgi:hypothetical protein
MAFSATQTPVAATGGASITTLAKTITAPATGSVLCATLLWYDGTNNTAGTVAISDGSGHSLTVQTPSNARPTTAGLVYLAYGIVAAGWGATWTATFNTTGGAGLASLYIAEFGVSGGTAAFDQAATGTGATGAPINTPTINVSGTGELLYAAAVSDHQVSTVDSPWTTIAAGIGTNFSEGVGYILSANSNTAVAMTQNVSVSTGWDSAAMSFTFTPATVGTGGNFRRAAGRPAPFKPMGDAFRTDKYRGWR